MKKMKAKQMHINNYADNSLNPSKETKTAHWLCRDGTEQKIEKAKAKQCGQSTKSSRQSKRKQQMSRNTSARIVFFDSKQVKIAADCLTFRLIVNVEMRVSEIVKRSSVIRIFGQIFLEPANVAGKTDKEKERISNNREERREKTTAQRRQSVQQFNAIAKHEHSCRAQKPFLHTRESEQAAIESTTKRKSSDEAI